MNLGLIKGAGIYPLAFPGSMLLGKGNVVKDSRNAFIKAAFLLLRGHGLTGCAHGRGSRLPTAISPETRGQTLASRARGHHEWHKSHRIGSTGKPSKLPAVAGLVQILGRPRCLFLLMDLEQELGLPSWCLEFSLGAGDEEDEATVKLMIVIEMSLHLTCSCGGTTSEKLRGLMKGARWFSKMKLWMESQDCARDNDEMNPVDQEDSFVT
ncbi:hypothetical protein QAD02_024390 [Eretmocerus hayati]|uniref:Uncharacterized protein n=1 Tax=Eretmocerus hayati TaxID=131215 RepID=A0ACC2PYV4_9HYME|nr:hypothetical protein QAD02_024390 [Eretmocerus hayati]